MRVAAEWLRKPWKERHFEVERLTRRAEQGRLAVAVVLALAATAVAIAPTAWSAVAAAQTPAPPVGSPVPGAGTMTVAVTVQLAGGKPASDGATLTPYALPSAASSLSGTKQPVACGAPVSVASSRAVITVDAACANTYASETGGSGVLVFELAFTNKFGQAIGAGSNHISFNPSPTAQPITLQFGVDPDEKFVAAGGTPAAETPQPPATGTPVTQAGGGPVVWEGTAGVAVILALAAALTLRRRITRARPKRVER